MLEIDALQQMSIKQLKRAIELGFSHPNLLINQPQWESVRDLPEFQEMIDLLQRDQS